MYNNDNSSTQKFNTVLYILLERNISSIFLLYLKLYAHSKAVMVVGNRRNDLSLNPGWSCLCFISCCRILSELFFITVGVTSQQIDWPSCDIYWLSSLLRSLGEPLPRTDVTFMIVLSWGGVSPSYHYVRTIFLQYILYHSFLSHVIISTSPWS